MIWRAFAMWFAILLLANLNGALRELWLIPQLAIKSGRAWCFDHRTAIGWIDPVTRGDTCCSLPGGPRGSVVCSDSQN